MYNAHYSNHHEPVMSAVGWGLRPMSFLLTPCFTTWFHLVIITPLNFLPTSTTIPIPSHTQCAAMIDHRLHVLNVTLPTQVHFFFVAIAIIPTLQVHFCIGVMFHYKVQIDNIAPRVVAHHLWNLWPLQMFWKSPTCKLVVHLRINIRSRSSVSYTHFNSCTLANCDKYV